MSQANPQSHRREDLTELEKLLRKAKPWFAENGTILIYVLAAILAVAAAIVYFNRTTPGNAEASHDLLKAQHSTGSPDKDLTYQDVADAFPDSQIGIWTRLRQADRLLDEGVSNMFKDRKTSLQQLDDAKKAYDRLVDRADVDDAVAERVLIGLARLAEARCDGGAETTDAAIAAWKNVTDKYPDSIVKEHAEKRMKELTTDESKQFYAWFAKQNPKPDDPGSLPGQSPVPNIPDLKSLGIDKDPEDDGAKSPEGEPEKSATEDGKSESTEGDKSDSGENESGKSAPGEGEAKEATNAKPGDADSDAKDSADSKPDGAAAGTPEPKESPAPAEKTDGDSDKLNGEGTQSGTESATDSAGEAADEDSAK